MPIIFVHLYGFLSATVLSYTKIGYKARETKRSFFCWSDFVLSKIRLEATPFYILKYNKKHVLLRDHLSNSTFIMMRETFLQTNFACVDDFNENPVENL